MPIKIDYTLTSQKLVPKLTRLFDLSAQKILSLERTWKAAHGTPVFTIRGRYTSRSWTEWTQGFQFGSALLQFEATGDERFLEIGRSNTIRHMAAHVSHTGVHDHGFNNISTYGNLLRLMLEGTLPHNEREQDLYELALKVSGAIQAARWTPTADGGGYIYSFNGPHSLFIDTIRSLRSLAVAHRLGHVLMGERDTRISLLQRLVQHASSSARYAIFYGEGRDAYDIRGRTAHESIFNIKDGSYRCPNSQQGYSPFSTWTRGLGWGLLGFAEQLEFLKTVPAVELKACAASQPAQIRNTLLRAARATADYYISSSCTDGIPMWDTGAPNLSRLGDYGTKPSEPDNDWEPVDSSAAAIAAQGLIRLGQYHQAEGAKREAARYLCAGLTVANTLLDEPYLATSSRHQGLLLHSVYHRPNGWDYLAPGRKIPSGESSMWGDYHARELALLLLRDARAEPYLTFYNRLPLRPLAVALGAPTCSRLSGSSAGRGRDRADHQSVH
jgi:unsaturated chondroitin disaccharide hydrolase